MKEYHLAWLSVHPHRTEEWLNSMLREGFDIHHMDGNHENNCPDNLVLIEHTDHMAIHGGRALGRLARVGRKKKKRKSVIKLYKGKPWGPVVCTLDKEVLFVGQRETVEHALDTHYRWLEELREVA